MKGVTLHGTRQTEQATRCVTPAYATPRVSEFREKASVAVTAKGWGAVGRMRRDR